MPDADPDDPLRKLIFDEEQSVPENRLTMALKGAIGIVRETYRVVPRTGLDDREDIDKYYSVLLAAYAVTRLEGYETGDYMETEKIAELTGLGLTTIREFAQYPVTESPLGHGKRIAPIHRRDITERLISRYCGRNDLSLDTDNTLTNINRDQ